MTGNKLVRANVETAADAGDNWWKSLSREQQKQYLKLHPNSKYGTKKGKAPESPKTKAKPAVVPKLVKSPDNKPKKGATPQLRRSLIERERQRRLKDVEKEHKKFPTGITEQHIKELKSAKPGSDLYEDFVAEALEAQDFRKEKNAFKKDVKTKQPGVKNSVTKLSAEVEKLKADWDSYVKNYSANRRKAMTELKAIQRSLGERGFGKTVKDPTKIKALNQRKRAVEKELDRLDLAYDKDEKVNTDKRSNVLVKIDKLMGYED